MARRKSRRRGRRKVRGPAAKDPQTSPPRSARLAAAQPAKAIAESERAARPRGAGENAGAPTAWLYRDTPAFLALALLVAASYFPAFSAGFVWDDIIFTEEPVIHRWSGLWNIWFSPADIRKEGHYWPVVYTTFWLEHKLWGLEPLGYHLVNVALHLANVVLAWRLLRILNVPGSWAIAAVFAVHPLHVESVAWIIERKDLLSTLFYICAVFAWIRFSETPSPGRYCLLMALFLAGLLSKSMVVTLPAALVILQWWRHGHVTRNDAFRLVPLLLVGLSVTAADLAFYTSREPLSLGYSTAERMLIAGHALWFYAGKLLWPTGLAVIYPLWDTRVGDPLGWLYVAAAAGLAILLWLVRRRLGRGPAAGAAFFAVTLSPVLGFIDFGYMQFSFVADRFQYLAGIGLMAVLVGGAARHARRLPGALRLGAAGAFAAALAALGTLTWHQAGIYRDEITFFSHVVAHNPEARDAHLNLGTALVDADRLEEGHAATLVAVRQRPDSASAQANLGSVLLRMERTDHAEVHLAKALELDPRNRRASHNMAELRRKQGRYEEAAELFRKVLAKDASSALAHASLGISLFRLGRHEEAIASMDRALGLAPDSPNLHSLHVLAGRSLEALGRRPAAERRFLRALEIDPNNADALADLSRLRIAERRFDEADTYLRRAVEAGSGNAASLQDAAEALRKQGRFEDALKAYRAVLELDPDYAMAHAGMGDVFFRLGRYEAAIGALDRSLQLDPAQESAVVRLILMAKSMEKLGRAGAAVEHYERAVELEPGSAQALDHLASSRFGQKRYQEALSLYRTLLEVLPDNARTHANIGAVLYHLYRPREALQSFERAVSLDPGLEAELVYLEHLRASLRRDAE